ncbi:hypothetical protein Taro_054680, partial [Colocasia esculenta]|nr:hypothetical protein [Colocasia esculenta]
MISPIPWFFGSSDSLDYANRWRSTHAEQPSHSDRKSCSSRREISSRAKELGITFRTGIEIAYVTTIRNRHSETVDRTLVSKNSVPGPKFLPGACVLVHRLPYPPVGRGYLFARGSEPPARPQFRIGTSTRSRLPRLRESLAEPTRGAAQSQRSEVVFKSTRDLLPSSDSLDYANRWRSPHAEQPSHSDRKSCSSRREISSRGRGYGCPNIADMVNGRIRRFPVRRPNSSPGAWSRAADLIAYGHRFAQTGITFRSVIGIAYKTPIRNQHSEALDAPLLPQAIRRRFGVEKPSFR